MDHKLSQLLQHSVGRDSELSITVDKATRKVVVKVLDSQTKELIRQIPPEELLHLFEGLKELSGALVDEVI